MGVSRKCRLEWTRSRPERKVLAGGTAADLITLGTGFDEIALNYSGTRPTPPNCPIVSSCDSSFDCCKPEPASRLGDGDSREGL